jgi:hypothetical protein
MCSNDKTDREILDLFLRGNKVLYKTYKINYIVLKQLVTTSISRYEMEFLQMKIIVLLCGQEIGSDCCETKTPSASA